MISFDEINAAIEEINPHVAATNSMQEAFGADEGIAQRRHLCSHIGVDYDALIDFGNTALRVGIEQGRDNPQEYAQGSVQGFLHGVLAAREEAGGV